MFNFALVFGLLFRWLHILAAATALGGAIFGRFALLPALEELPDAERATFNEKVRGRWSKIVAGAILFLLVSGLFNFVSTIQKYQVPSAYHMLFGIKFILAFAMFFLASALAGRSSLAQRLRQRARFWMAMNITLGVVIVILSGALRELKTNAPLKSAVASQVETPPAIAPVTAETK